jgi:hypothetical protein
MPRDQERFARDFEYVRTRIDEFFSRRAVGRALATIDELGITGWEKWWQVEFATWLADHDQIAEWVMEEVFLTDLRRNTAKNSIAIDIGFRMKGYSTKEMLFLELKQNDDIIKCVTNMLTDAEKVYSAQKRSVSNGLMIRSFFVVGIYPSGKLSKKEIHDYILDRADEREIPVDRENIFTKFIPDSPFNVTVF